MHKTTAATYCYVSMYLKCQPEILPTASACASSEIAVGGAAAAAGTGEHATGEVPPPPRPAQAQQPMNDRRRYKYICMKVYRLHSICLHAGRWHTAKTPPPPTHPPIGAFSHWIFPQPQLL